MNRLYFLFSMLVLSCTSPKKYQTYTYHQYAQQHHSLAIIPVRVEGREIDPKVNADEANKLLLKEQDFIQNYLYQRIARETGTDEKDIHISIMSPNKTNNLLKENGIDLLKCEDLSDAQLLKILNVDAVLKTTVSTKIMLHSTDADLAKEAINIAASLTQNRLLCSIANTDLHAVFLNAEIVDLKNESPIWTYSKKRNLEVNDKHTVLLEKLCNDVAKRFPYRSN
jgi:hypothetical protein